MRAFFVMLLLAVVLLVALPVASGMDMRDEPCPACVATGSAAVGLCLGILSVFAMALGGARGSSLLERRHSARTTALAAVFRPPQPL